MLDDLRRSGVARGDLVALVVAPDVGVGLATPAGSLSVPAAADDAVAVVRSVEEELRPRWVMWSNATAIALVEGGLRVATSWDIAAVHRLLFGGWRAEPARVWAQLHDLALDAIPTTKPLDLFSDPAHEAGPPDEPVRGDGYLRPEWASGEWSSSPERLARWAELAMTVAQLQQDRLAALDDRPRARDRARGVGGRAAVRGALGRRPPDRPSRGGSAHCRVRRCAPELGDRGGRTARGATPRCSATRRRVPTATCGAPVR